MLLRYLTKAIFHDTRSLRLLRLYRWSSWRGLLPTRLSLLPVLRPATAETPGFWSGWKACNVRRWSASRGRCATTKWLSCPPSPMTCAAYPPPCWSSCALLLPWATDLPTAHSGLLLFTVCSWVGRKLGRMRRKRWGGEEGWGLGDPGE